MSEFFFKSPCRHNLRVSWELSPLRGLDHNPHFADGENESPDNKKPCFWAQDWGLPQHSSGFPSLSGRSPPTWPNAKSGTTLGGVGLNSFFPLSGILPSEELIFRINQKAESFPTGSLCIPDPLNFPKLGHWDCQWLEELADTPTSTGVQ